MRYLDHTMMPVHRAKTRGRIPQEPGFDPRKKPHGVLSQKEYAEKYRLPRRLVFTLTRLGYFRDCTIDDNRGYKHIIMDKETRNKGYVMQEIIEQHFREQREAEKKAKKNLSPPAELT